MIWKLSVGGVRGVTSHTNLLCKRGGIAITELGCYKTQEVPKSTAYEETCREAQPSKKGRSNGCQDNSKIKA